MALSAAAPRDSTRILRTAAALRPAALGTRLNDWGGRASAWAARLRRDDRRRRIAAGLLSTGGALPLAALGSVVLDTVGRLGPQRRTRWDGRLGAAADGLLATTLSHPLRALVVGLVAGYALGFIACRVWASRRGGALVRPSVSGVDGAREPAPDVTTWREALPEIPPPSTGQVHDEVKLDVMGMESFPASDAPATLGGITPGGRG